MKKKRKYLLFIMTFILSINNQCHTSKPVSQSPVELVYPLLDAANSRWFFFNTATRPFGMVHLSPDTELGGAWDSGYKFDTDTIKCFSHIHGWQISGVAVMPLILEAPAENYFSDYFSKFQHEKEQVEVGYYKVVLDRYDITAELTATKRVGFHRYHFPQGKEAAVLFQLQGMLGPCEIIKGELKRVDNRTLAGQLVDAPTIRRPREFPVFFSVSFNQDFVGMVTSDSSKNIVVTFGKQLTEPLRMKVAISYTSIENARNNLSYELNHWDFDQVVSDAKDEWNELLDRIAIEGGSKQQQRRFYTDLWHALQGRRIISDVNGAYPDNTGATFRIGQLPLDDRGKPKFNHYNSDSFWGAQWTLNTLWGLVYPDIYDEFINSFLTYYKDGGLFPRGPSGGNYTYVMTGAATTPFVVSAYQKGIRNYDAEYAYNALVKNHQPGGMMGHAGYEHKSAKGGGIEYYIEKGYVPYPLPDGGFGFHQDGAGMTLEYAYQDWTLAQMAKALGKDTDYKYYMTRSQNYRNLFDPQSGWIRPRDVNGKWREPFDPYEYKSGFVESNAAQAFWFVPQDLNSLADLAGGKDKAVERLNTQFIEAEKLGFTAGTSHAQEEHPEYRRIPINYGNQVSIQTAFVFNHLGRPDLTQYWSRRIVKAVYSGLSPYTGYSGDEDQGLMGALAVLMKIGLFQVNGGTEANPGYDIGSPIFDKVTIKLHPKYYANANLVISTLNNSAENIYVKNIKFNQKPVSGFGMTHRDLIQGGELILEMTKVKPY